MSTSDSAAAGTPQLTITKREANRIICALWRAVDWSDQSALCYRGSAKTAELRVAERYRQLARKLQRKVSKR